MLRSLIFNVVYYIGTLVIGVVIVPALLLPERKYLLFIRGYFRLVTVIARYLLRLKYIQVGRGYLPTDQPYIVAAKHQSAFETLLLPVIFDHPIVILKRELLQIPFWGWYAKKAGNIGINRNKPREALSQMMQGVAGAVARGRTIVIFPQGTRVGVHETPAQKPYKRGIAEMYKNLNIAIVPMALNSGVFWPRNAFMKRGGTVTLKFLPPILPGLDEAEFMRRLEQTLETESALLVEQAQTDLSAKRRTHPMNWVLGTAAALIYLYTGLWFGFAYFMQREINRAWEQAPANELILSNPPARISGYPGKFQITWAGTMQSPQTDLTLAHLNLSFWPIPLTPLTLDLTDVLIKPKQMLNPNAANGLRVDRLRVIFQIPPEVPPVWTKDAVQKLHDRGITYRLLSLEIDKIGVGDLILVKTTGSGQLAYDENLQPDGTFDAVFSDPDHIRDTLTQIIQHPMGKSFIGGMMDSLIVTDIQSGLRTLPMTFRLKNGNVYAGPLKVWYFGQTYWPVVDPGNAVPLTNFEPTAPTSTSPLTRP